MLGCIGLLIKVAVYLTVFFIVVAFVFVFATYALPIVVGGAVLLFLWRLLVAMFR
jgi:hypothetical protein